MTFLRWLPFLLESQTVLIVPLFWIYLFLLMLASISSTMAFPPLGNSDHVVALVFIDFPTNSQQDALFHCIAYGYSCADWDGLCDDLRDVPWEDIFKFSDSAAASEFCEWGQVGIDVYIPYRKYQIKPHSSPWFSAACCAAIILRNHLFHLYQREKSSDSKVKFRQGSNRCKRVLEAAKLAYANKTKESITSQKLGSRDFWRIADSVLNKGKSAIPPLFIGLEVLSAASDKAKFFAENFSMNSNLDDSGISLPVFPSRTNLKLHISVTPKMVRKVVMNLNLSKAYGHDCIPVVVQKNCEQELSYILAELFNKCLKESCFPDCWKVSSVVPVFKNVGERSTTKNYCLVSLLSVVGEVFEKLVNNGIVDHLEKCSLLISSMVLGLLDQLLIFSQLYLIELIGLLTDFGLVELWHLIYPRHLTGFGMLVLFTNLSLMKFQVRYLALFLLFSVLDNFKWF